MDAQTYLPIHRKTRKEVVHADGKRHDFMLKVGGNRFRCAICGANVFHKPDDRFVELYACNGCDQEYWGDS